MAQPMEIAPTFTVRLQKGISSSLQPGSSPALVLELASTSGGEYELTTHTRNPPTKEGVESSMYETSLGKLMAKEVHDLGIWSAVSALETMPEGGHEKDTYGADAQIFYSKPPSFEWFNGPPVGSTISPPGTSSKDASPIAKQAGEPTDEDKARFAHIIEVLGRLQGQANKAVGSGKLDAKGTEPDMALED